LIKNNSLVLLSLSNNYLGINSAYSLAKVIKLNKTIKKIDLKFNKLGTKG